MRYWPYEDPYVLSFVIAAHVVWGQEQWKNVYKESAWKERDEWQRPEELIKYLKLRPGNSVADIGCNEGYMTVKLSKAVGDKGKVYAVDVDKAKLDLLKEHLDSRSIGNVTLVKGEYDDPKQTANSLDGVIILDSYHEMDDHDAILVKVKAALKVGGRLVICEPIQESRRKFSRSEQEKKHELAMPFAIADLQKAGYEIRTHKDPFVDRVKVKGDVMWLVVAIKK